MLVDIGKIKEMLFTGETLTTEEAFRIGLVNRVVPSGQLDDTLRAYAEKLLAAPSLSVEFLKHV
jgi:enoyl-CoA hydratase/carnithine racemase